MNLPSVLFKKIRTRFRPHALILEYFQVSNCVHNPLQNNVLTSYFAEHMDVLRRYTNPVSLKELVAGLHSKRLNGRSVAITFDFGYSDFIYRVKPILEKYGLYSTVFVDYGQINSEYWWDKLIRYILSSSIMPEELSIYTENNNFFWRQSEDKMEDPKSSLFRKAYYYLYNQTDVQRKDFFNTLLNYSQPDFIPDHIYRTLNKDELKLIALEPFIEIGAQLNSELSEIDLSRNKTNLEELTGTQINGLSISKPILSRFLVKQIRNAGYSYSCTNSEDVIYLRSDPYKLHRLRVPNCNGDDFYKFINSWIN